MSFMKLISDEFKVTGKAKEEKYDTLLNEFMALTPTHLGLCMGMFTLNYSDHIVVGNVPDFVSLFQKGDKEKSADYFCAFIGENSDTTGRSLGFIDLSQKLFAKLFTTRLDEPFQTLVELVIKTYRCFEKDEPIIKLLVEIYDMVCSAIANIRKDTFLEASKDKVEYHALFFTLIVGTITAELEKSKKFIQLYVALVCAQLEIDQEAELRISFINNIVKGYSDQNLAISQFFQSKETPKAKQPNMGKEKGKKLEKKTASKPNGKKRGNEEETDSESAFGSGVMVKKQRAETEELTLLALSQHGLKFPKLTHVTKNMKHYILSVVRRTVDDPPTTDKTSMIFAVLLNVLSLLPETSKKMLEGIFCFLGCFIVSQNGATVLAAALNIPGPKKALDQMKLDSITHLNTFAVTILGSFPVLMTNTGNSIIFYIPTPELLREVNAVHPSGYLNMNIDWDIKGLNFDDEDKFTIVEVSIKAPDIPDVHKQVLLAICIVACNLLQLEKKIPKASEPLLPHEKGSFINTVTDKIYRLFKEHTQFAFSAPTSVYSIINWVLSKDNQSTSKDLYVELLTSIIKGFEEAASLFLQQKQNHATLEGMPQQALESAPVNLLMQAPNVNPAALCNPNPNLL